MAYDDKVEEPETTENTTQTGVAKGSAAPQRRGVFNTLYPPGNRVKGHYKRFWWCDLILTIIIVLVVVLPVILVAIPRKAQHDINHSTLTVDSQVVTSPTPDNVHLRFVTTARSYSAFHPKLDAFQGALFLENTEPDIKPFTYIDIPATKADKETQIVVDQTVKIADADQFAAYNRLVIGSEEFRVGLRGRTGLHQPGLSKIMVDYNKGITMKGLNKLKGFNITDFDILLTPLPDGSNMNGTISIPNPSVLTVDLGNVTMDLSVAGQAIGTSSIPNLVLKPGNNSLSMFSTVNQTLVINLITSKYQNGIVPIDIIGNSSVSNGQHLTYYESAIQSNPMHIDLNVGSALKKIGLNITS